MTKVRGSRRVSPITTAPKSIVGVARAILAFLVVALSGTVIGPVAVLKVISLSMSWLILGENLMNRSAVTPADMRPGGTCESSKKEATASGSAAGRKALNVYDTFVSVNLISYALPTSKSAKRITFGLQMNAGPDHVLPPTT